MVANWDFPDQVGATGVGAGGTDGVVQNSGTEQRIEKRRIQGTKVGSVTLSLAKKKRVLPVLRHLNPAKIGKRGPKPKSDRVLNVVE